MILSIRSGSKSILGGSVMQLSGIIHTPLKRSVVFVALFGAFLLVGCGRQQESPPPPPVPEVAVVTVEPQRATLTI